MKLKTTLLFLMAFMSMASAQLVSYEFIRNYSIAEMEQIINDFGAGGILIPSYSVDLYRATYRTEYNDSTVIVTGAVVIPQNMVCKAPLISYQHGTSSSKLGVPSYGSSELQICLVFASEGNVLVAPDYIGLGGSPINLHPYQHAFSQAHSTINLLRATRALQDDLNFELSNQIFLFGYSQGGHATASAVKYIEQLYSDEFQITAAMPMSGAYDLSGEQTDFINNGLPYATPGYLPYIVMGYQSVYHDLYDSIQEIFVPPYDSTMPYYLLGHNYGIGFINNQCDPYPIEMFTQTARDAFFNDPSFPFKLRLKENDLLDWTPQTKMRMFYCSGDEQVYYRNSVVADSVWNYNGAPDVEAILLTNEDHGGCVDNALIGARLLYGSLVNNGVEIILTLNANGNEVSVDVLDDDINDYDIVWSNGSTGTSIAIQDGLSYTVELSHKTKGCNNTKSFTKASVLGLKEKNTDLSLSLFPNPASQFLTIDASMEDLYTLKILDVTGREIFVLSDNQSAQVILNIQGYSSGTYFVVLKGENTYQSSFFKQ